MLTQLTIRNLLLFTGCTIPFGSGLNALTGETGAGKSILLDGLGLVLGERSDASLLRPGESQASVAAEFEVASHPAVQGLMAELELPASDQLILRRTLGADGKSRGFANDEPVSVATLKRFGELLVVRHGQHDQRGLLDSKTHRDLLDRFAGNAALLQLSAHHYADRKAAGAARDALEQRAAEAAREEEWLRDTVRELQALDPQPGEEVALAELRKKSQVAQASVGALREAIGLLADSGGVALNLRQVAKLLGRAQLGDETLTAALERAETEVEEISVALERLLAAAAVDPDTVERAEDRLHALRAAARKYKLAAENLPGLLADSTAKLATLSHLESERATARAALAKAEADYKSVAGQLFTAREKAAVTLIALVARELKPLKMGSTRLSLQQQELPPTGWGPQGMHGVSFEVATNAGMKPGPMHKVASGGELSRLLLAMKLVLQADEPVTAIFDEIDTGTGGAVAEAIGHRLRQLAAHGQVLAVTHLPQVAAQAAHHLFISKSGRKEVTTQVRQLSETERQEELARMLSGATISDEARRAAGKLLQAAS